MRRSGLAIVCGVAAFLSACLSPAEPLPPAVRGPIEALLGEGGLSYPRAAKSPDFIRRASLSAEDAADWIVDFNEAQGPYCGTGGCPLQVWVKGPDGGYRIAFDQQVLGWRMEDDGSHATRLSVRLHGALCGRSGLEDCEYAFRWTINDAGEGYFSPARPMGGGVRYAGPLVQPIRLDPDAAPTPARYAVKAFEAACMRAGGAPETEQSLQYLPDLNGDGAREMLFDPSIAWCWREGGAVGVRPDCKASSCHSRLFTREKGVWREVLARPGLDYEIEFTEGARAVMIVEGRPVDWSVPSRTS